MSSVSLIKAFAIRWPRPGKLRLHRLYQPQPKRLRVVVEHEPGLPPLNMPTPGANLRSLKARSATRMRLAARFAVLPCGAAGTGNRATKTIGNNPRRVLLLFFLYSGSGSTGRRDNLFRLQGRNKIVVVELHAEGS